MRTYCPLSESPTFSGEDLAAVGPLLAHLQTNVSVADVITFPRGTIMADGRLDLCKQSLGLAGCRRVTEALTGNTVIRSVLLGTNGIGDAGAVDVARLITRNPNITTVYLGCNHIGETGAVALAKALTDNATVTGLWLKRNPIGPAGVQALAEMLRHNRTLRTLDLVNTQIGAEGLSALLPVLTHENRGLERLYLSGNGLNAEAALGLAGLVRNNSWLRALLLSANPLGHEGVAALSGALSGNRTLMDLGLASVGLTSLGATLLLEAVSSHPLLTVLDLGRSPSASVLGVPANAIGDGGAEAAGRLLRCGSMLRRLDLRGSHFGPRGEEALAGGLEQNTSLQRLLLDEPVCPRLAALLTKLRASSPDVPPADDVALIRSVSRAISTP